MFFAQTRPAGPGVNSKPRCRPGKCGTVTKHPAEPVLGDKRAPRACKLGNNRDARAAARGPWRLAAMAGHEQVSAGPSARRSRTESTGSDDRLPDFEYMKYGYAPARGP